MKTYEEAKNSWDERYSPCLENNCLTWSVEFAYMGGVPNHNEKCFYKSYESECDHCQNPCD